MVKMEFCAGVFLTIGKGLRCCLLIRNLKPAFDITASTPDVERLALGSTMVLNDDKALSLYVTTDLRLLLYF